MSKLRSLLQEDLSPHELVVAISEHLRLDHDVLRFGSFSPSIYDTAWVSMIRRRDTSPVTWLFPESFDYLLQTQRDNGTWESYATPVDGILNTLASLLALLVHREAAEGLDVANDHDRADLSRRIERAHEGVRVLLRDWRVEDTVHVGFEVLVPGLLSQLRQYGPEYDFDFPGRRQLDRLQKRKTQKFKPESMYSPQASTLLHSMEAFVGLIDFDRVAHHCKKDTGIFGSPAATAVYLINASSWDPNAEHYLETVISQSDHGGVPSAFPTVLFEASWALSSLLATTVPYHHLQPHVIEDLTSFFRGVIERQSGVVGFAPGILEDADDTARVLLTLYRLGLDVDPAPMIDRFRSASHFRTYRFEGSPSFSANCNILLALLSSNSADVHSDLTRQTLEYLLSIWISGELKDKWNLSPYYSTMLLLDVLVNTLTSIDEGRLSHLPLSLASHTIPVTICQLLSKTIYNQEDDGSWNHSVEETSYSMYTIARCLMLPWPASVRQDVLDSYHKASRFIIQTPKNDDHDYVWVEKVTYGSMLLRKVYRLLALNMDLEPGRWSPDLSASFAMFKQYPTMLRPMLEKMPLFAGASLKYVDLAFIEASRFRERLQTLRNVIFPRDQLPLTKDQYLAFIPVIWTVCNQRRGHVLSSTAMWEMCLHSMLIYHVDEYMETVVNDLPPSEVSQLSSDIDRFCDPAHICCFEGGPKSTNTLENPVAELNDTELHPHHPEETKESRILNTYIARVLNHTSVLHLSPLDHQSLARSLRDFLHSHLIQNANSRILRDAPEEHAGYRNGNGRVNGHVNGHVNDKDHNADNGYDSSNHKGTTNGDENHNANSNGQNDSIDHHHNHNHSNNTLNQNSHRHRRTPFTNQDFFTWVRGPGAQTTSCPMAFRFFTALLGPLAAQALSAGPRARYLCRAVGAHLASLCRMYNDYGSADRDAREGNLNSLDFGEFGYRGAEENAEEKKEEEKEGKNGKGEGEEARSRKMREELLGVAQFERWCTERAFAELGETVREPGVLAAIRVYIDVTDMFGQIYVLKDLSGRAKKTG